MVKMVNFMVRIHYHNFKMAITIYIKHSLITVVMVYISSCFFTALMNVLII